MLREGRQFVLAGGLAAGGATEMAPPASWQSQAMLTTVLLLEVNLLLICISLTAERPVNHRSTGPSGGPDLLRGETTALVAQPLPYCKVWLGVSEAV
jgi:hypothetical protein